MKGSSKSKLSKPKHEVKYKINVMVPMRDGTRLATDIYKPDVEGRFPSILVRLPYGKTEGYCEMPAFGDYFAKRGYAFVVQDVRGQYDSEGARYPWVNEPDDGYMTQEWVAKQPWCDGKIGTIGDSYYGYTQWASAPKQCKNLKTMITVVMATDLYGDLYYFDGALHLWAMFGWHYTIQGSRASLFHGIEDLDLIPTVKALNHLPLFTADEAAGLPIRSYRDVIKHPNKDEYWEGKTDYPFHKVNVPVLHIGGWYDVLLRGQLKDYVAMTQKAATPEARKSQRLVVGPWHHEIGRFGPPEARGIFKGRDIDFGDEADIDLMELCLRWFDYWLKGVDNGVMDGPPVNIFVMGKNKWRHEEEWPLKRAQYTRYYLHSGGKANTLNGDGSLSTVKPGDEPSDTYEYAPLDPVPSPAGNAWYLIETIKDQRVIEERKDVLVYCTPSLEEPVEVTGPVSMKLYASSTAKDTDFTGKLVDVHPSGYAQYIQEGIIRARYRESREKPTLIEPGKVYEYSIDMWATSNLFKPGHKIRVEVSSSNFPRYDRNPNTGHEFGMDAETLKATQTIYHDSKHPSHIILPLIPM